MSRGPVRTGLWGSSLLRVIVFGACALYMLRGAVLLATRSDAGGREFAAAAALCLFTLYFSGRAVMSARRWRTTRRRPARRDATTAEERNDRAA
jgi:alkanesulfonate monooxygenase SsuD/methylene tetrahydromethanopterin reductase-like flavin-dependent oxidoreductase (luciferase family)